MMPTLLSRHRSHLGRHRQDVRTKPLLHTGIATLWTCQSASGDGTCTTCAHVPRNPDIYRKADVRQGSAAWTIAV